MAREFSLALKQSKCEVRLVEVKERNHMTILFKADQDQDPVNQAIRTFIDDYTRANGKR
jgi:hypothetical protein